MTGQNEFDKTSDPRKKDLKFVLIMLAVYTACCVVFVSGSFLWIRDDRNTAQANATATEEAIITQQANATTTAVAHLIEQDGYEYIERFNKSTGNWFVGDYEKQSADAHLKIMDGTYIWEIKDAMGNALSTDFFMGNTITDFDVYVDVKFAELPETGPICGGFFFRKPSYDWSYGAYVFDICENGRYKILYYNEDGWQSIAEPKSVSEFFLPEWNRIEIRARRDRFTFFINNIEIHSLRDNRLRRGSLGIFVEIEAQRSASIWFNNFGYQSH